MAAPPVPVPPTNPPVGKQFDILESDVPSLPKGFYEIVSTTFTHYFEVKTNGHGENVPVAERTCTVVCRLKRL